MEPEGSFTSARHLPCPETDRSSPCPYKPSIPIYTWVFQVVSFPLWSSPQTCTHLRSPHMCYIPRHLILLDFITRTMLGKEYRSSSSSLCSFSPLLCHLVPLRPKYSPQHLILKLPQPTFLPQSERPRFTPILPTLT